MNEELDFSDKVLIELGIIEDDDDFGCDREEQEKDALKEIADMQEFIREMGSLDVILKVSDIVAKARKLAYPWEK